MAYGRLGKLPRDRRGPRGRRPRRHPCLGWGGATRYLSFALRRSHLQGMSLGMVQSPDALRTLCQISESDVVHVHCLSE